KIRGGLAVVLVVAALAGAAGLIYQTQAAEQPIATALVPVNHVGGGDTPEDEGPAAAAGGGADEPRERPHVRPSDLTGRVVAVGTGWKSVTVTGGAPGRPAEWVPGEVTIGEKAVGTYSS